MNFSKERFANFAKYDLAINKVFYRNLALFTTIGAVGIAVLGFMGRYTMWKSVTFSDGGIDSDPFSYSGYNSLFGTAGYVVGFLGIMLYIFAGCSFHNLRNKQGRITELTLPATNLEKFVWHTGLMLGGGFILCILSLLLADGVNALLTLAVYGSEGGVASLAAAVGDIFSLHINIHGIYSATLSGGDSHTEGELIWGARLVKSISFCLVFVAIAETIVYLFGNAVKYKYNIILTYVAMQVLGFIIVILFFVGVAIYADRIDAITEVENGGEILLHNMTVGFYIIGSLALILAAFLGWKSYRLYTQAQITTPLNK
ncbi:MAG: hypothetical protein IJ635_04005 [Bacteroidaceae bacterium]|nr:hypothetical protein [Bacteroidaceae bacterium]MBR1520382.1 hypothetical protein [Bacteroidaceae bacterium]